MSQQTMDVDDVLNASRKETAPTAKITPTEPLGEPSLQVQSNIPADSRQIESGVVHKGTKFYWGRWDPKMNPVEPNDVKLGVNGEIIKWQRGVRTIVPFPYLDVANHTLYPKYTREVGKGMKVASMQKRCNFQIEKEATFEEFKTLFDAGTRATRIAESQLGSEAPAEGQPTIPALY